MIWRGVVLGKRRKEEEGRGGAIKKGEGYEGEEGERGGGGRKIG